MKDGNMVDPDADSNFIIYDDGTLIVDSVRVEDAGEYICVARNSAGTRASRPAILELYCESALSRPLASSQDGSLRGLYHPEI